MYVLQVILMPRNPQTAALQRLVVSHRNHAAAQAAQVRTKMLYHEAIFAAAAAGVSKAEIARTVGTSDVRVHQILRDAKPAAVSA